MARARRTPRPATKPGELNQIARKALDLATADRVVLDPRLPAGMIDHMRADLDTLDGRVASVQLARSTSKAATVAQDAALERAAARVSAIRNTVSDCGLPIEAKRAWGVGVKVNPQNVASVTSGTRRVLDRAAAHPAEAAQAGVLPNDLTELSALLDAATNANRVQEGARSSAPLSTADRNATARRIEAAVRRISMVGQLAFIGGEKHAQYAALWAPGGHRKKPTETKPAPAPIETKA